MTVLKLKDFNLGRSRRAEMSPNLARSCRVIVVPVLKQGIGAAEQFLCEPSRGTPSRHLCLLFRIDNAPVCYKPLREMASTSCTCFPNSVGGLGSRLHL